MPKRKEEGMQEFELSNINECIILLGDETWINMKL